MTVDDILEQYPKSHTLPDGTGITIRPLQMSDEKPFHTFFNVIPETERLLFKNRVTDRSVIHDWCHHIDYGRILPLLAFDKKTVAADASLHQQLGGWKRHIGRISVVTHPHYRGQGLAKLLVRDLIDIARRLGLEKLEAEFLGEQQAARHIFAELGFSELLLMKDYVKDMQAITHDYVLMGRSLITDEEFAAAN